MSLDELRTDIVILACAISAGIHGALAPAHFDEGAGAGLGFVAATVLLTGLAVTLTFRPANALAVIGAALVFTGLIVSYVLVTTTGVPVLHPAVEPVDGLALATKALEAVGLLAASSVLRRLPASVPPSLSEGAPTWTAPSPHARFR